MTTFNKILNPMYSAISAFSISEDGSINATYVVGTGEDSEGSVTNFTPIISAYKYMNNEQAQQIINAPLAKEDIGKTPNQIMLDRIYNYLKSTGEIVV